MFLFFSLLVVCSYVCHVCVCADGTEDIDIPVNKAIPSDINSFVLRFEARNTDDDIVFSNSSHVQLNRINHVALIQTDKTIYKGGQTGELLSPCVTGELLSPCVTGELLSLCVTGELLSLCVTGELL